MMALRGPVAEPAIRRHPRNWAPSTRRQRPPSPPQVLKSKASSTSLPCPAGRTLPLATRRLRQNARSGNCQNALGTNSVPLTQTLAAVRTAWRHESDASLFRPTPDHAACLCE